MAKVETFKWVVENMVWCVQNGTKINSAPFLVEGLKNTMWYLQLHFKGEDVSFNLNRCHNDKGPESISVMYRLTFLSTTEANLRSMKSSTSKSFGQSGCSGFDSFITRYVLFGSRKSDLLPNDVLTATCQIWEPSGKVVKAVEVCGRTRIGLERICLVGYVEKFSELELGIRKEIVIQTGSVGNFFRSMSIFLSYGLFGSTDIILKLDISGRNNADISCKISLINKQGQSIESAHVAIPTNQLDCGEAFFVRLLHSKQDMILKKATHLPNDVLTLNFEFLRTDGVIVFDAVETEYAGHRLFRTPLLGGDNVDKDCSRSSLKEDLWTFFESGHLCDKKLETSTRSFEVHSHILSARSPVFCAMFSVDMKEKREDSIPIPDIDANIVYELLRFIYKETISDLNHETAVRLFSAADKYQVLSLRNICADYLKTHLTTKNTCEVLVIADRYQDEEMMAAVVKFIKNHLEILDSSEWEELEEGYPVLIHKTFRKIFLK